MVLTNEILFFFFFLFRAAPEAYGGLGLGVESRGAGGSGMQADIFEKRHIKPK